MAGALEFDVYKVNPPGDSTTFQATLEDAKGKVVFIELNGEGSVAFDLWRHSPNANTDTIRKDNLVKVRLPAVQAEPIASGFMEKGGFELISSAERGGEDLHFEGRGGLAYWDRAIWLNQILTLPWWPDCLTGGPAAGAKGAVVVQAGRYRAYTTGGSPLEITGFTDFSTPGFCASFNQRRTYVWPGANPDGSDSKRFLVHLLDGPHSGIYFHPHQKGVQEYLASMATGTTNADPAIPLSSVGATPGAVLRHMYDEAVATDRPQHPVPLMTVDFDDALDSNGDPWATTDALEGLTANVNENYLDTVGLLLGTGELVVAADPDLGMHAYNAPGPGTDRTGAAFGPGVVLFRKGTGTYGSGNIVDTLQRELGEEPEATFAQVQGSDNVYANAELPDAASRIAREIGTSGDSIDPAVLEAIGLAELRLRLARGEVLSFPIHVGNDPDNGRYTPGPPGSTGHFWIGDTVSLTTGSTPEDFEEEPVIVSALTLSENDAGELRCIVQVRTGPLASMGSLSQLSPEASHIGDDLGECGCPPFNAVCDAGAMQFVEVVDATGGAVIVGPTVTLAGVDPGDLLIADISFRVYGETLTLSPAFTPVMAQQHIAPSYQTIGHQTLYRIAQAGDTGVITSTGTGTHTVSLTVRRYKGIDTLQTYDEDILEADNPSPNMCGTVTPATGTPVMLIGSVISAQGDPDAYSGVPAGSATEDADIARGGSGSGWYGHEVVPSPSGSYSMGAVITNTGYIRGYGGVLMAWACSGGGILPEYGQEVVGDYVNEVPDGSNTDYTLHLGSIVGYKTDSLFIEQNGVDVTPYVIETDPSSGAFSFINPPPVGTEIVVRSYQAAQV